MMEQGLTGIRLEASYPEGAIVLPWVNVTIDGQGVPGVGWGSTYIPVVPGEHVVTSAQGGFWGIPVRADVPVVAGHVTQVYYRAPLFSKGPRELCIGKLGPVAPTAEDMRRERQYLRYFQSFAIPAMVAMVLISIYLLYHA
ncbi:hypothetical protein VMT65_11815 [Nocardia sp. CDC153]|uniref:hypothetical protein n=1 Tax=Nocardia sp. CDC153 TaxID=3112167 RepID=UPI002DBE6807|nr:hypothetical protein [Nocardia sp. CDC153]MEC3953722.1 hypothetical protein [Nocardia sp. CDC153]